MEKLFRGLMLQWYNQQEWNAGKRCRKLTTCLLKTHSESAFVLPFFIPRWQSAPEWIKRKLRKQQIWPPFQEGFSLLPTNKRPQAKGKILWRQSNVFLLCSVTRVQRGLKEPKPSSAQAAWAAVIKGNKRQDNQDWSESSVTGGVLRFKDTASLKLNQHQGRGTRGWQTPRKTNVFGSMFCFNSFILIILIFNFLFSFFLKNLFAFCSTLRNIKIKCVIISIFSEFFL